jgi:hypothetical protein
MCKCLFREPGTRGPTSAPDGRSAEPWPIDAYYISPSLPALAPVSWRVSASDSASGSKAQRDQVHLANVTGFNSVPLMKARWLGFINRP